MFFFNDLLTSVIYTLSLHDALPIYDSEGLIRKETVNTRIYTSWKDPRLYFENVPVREIIKRYEHTFGIPFTVSDKELLDRTVSGSVENSNLEVMARIFAEILDVTVEVTDNHVHIRNS